MNKLKLIPILACILVLFSCNDGKDKGGNKGKEEKVGTTLYHGGDIVTMQGDEPQYVESVVQKDGKIVFVGSKDEALEKHKNAKQVDLMGKTLLPAFLDGHGHFYLVGFTSQVDNLLPPPNGPGANFESIITSMNIYKDSDKGKYAFEKLG